MTCASCHSPPRPQKAAIPLERLLRSALLALVLVPVCVCCATAFAESTRASPIRIIVGSRCGHHVRYTCSGRWPETIGTPGPASHHRRVPRGRRHYRREACRQRTGGRLYAAACLVVQPGARRSAVPESALRSNQGFRADWTYSEHTVGPCGQLAGTGKDNPGIGRVCQSQPGQADRWLDRHRKRGVVRDRHAHKRRWNRHPQRSLQDEWGSRPGPRRRRG